MEIYRKDVVHFSSFANRVLKSGGYVLISTKVDMFQEWVSSFNASGFSCMEVIYVFSYNPKNRSEETK